jgi:ADP-glucose pyrophosphorylase
VAHPHVFAMVLAGGEGKRLAPLLGNYVTPVPAQMRRGPRWFADSADAILA